MAIDRKSLKEHVLKCGKETIDAYRMRFKNLDENQKRFDALRSTACLNDDVKRTPWVGAANVGIPLEQFVVYTLQSRFLKAEFGVDPSCRVSPWDLPYSESIQRYINWELYTEMELFMEKLLWYQGMLVDGDKIIKTVIDREEVMYDDDTILFFDENDQPLISEETGAPVEAESEDQPDIFDPVRMKTYKPAEAVNKKNRLIYYGPKAINIPAKCFLVPQNADNINPSKLEWNIHEFWRPYGWVHQKAEQYPNLFDRDEVLALKKDKDKSRAMKEDYKMKSLGIDFKTKTKMFKFHEWHGRWEDDKGDVHELVALVCPDEKRFLGYVSNRFFFKTGRRQFVHYTAFPQDGKFWGRSVPDIMRGIRSMMDALVNGGLDENTLRRHPPILFNLKQSGFDPTEHKFGTGKAWGLNNISQDMIRYMEMPQSGTVDSFEYEQLLFSIIQKIFGISDLSMGGAGSKASSITGPTAKTASGIASLLQESNIRFNVYIYLLQKYSNPELALQVWKHFTMNRFGIMEESKQLNKPRDVFDPIMKLSEDEINHNFEYTFPGNTDTINPMMEQQSVMAIDKILIQQQNPYFVQDADLVNQWTQQTLNAFGSKLKIKSVDEFRKYVATEKSNARQIIQKARQEQVVQPQGQEDAGDLIGAGSMQ